MNVLHNKQAPTSITSFYFIFMPYLFIDSQYE